MGDIVVSVEDSGAKGAFVARRGGDELGRMTFSRAGDARVIADHTEVSDAAKGQGVGQLMFDALVAWARDQRVRVVPLCPYVASRFTKQPEAADVLDR